jgi:hypothetical protein
METIRLASPRGDTNLKLEGAQMSATNINGVDGPWRGLQYTSSWRTRGGDFRNNPCEVVGGSAAARSNEAKLDCPWEKKSSIQLWRGKALQGGGGTRTVTVSTYVVPKGHTYVLLVIKHNSTNKRNMKIILYTYIFDLKYLLQTSLY